METEAYAIITLSRFPFLPLEKKKMGEKLLPQL